MNTNNQSWRHYLVTPRTDPKPAKIDKILEERLRRHKHARELRLTFLESVKSDSASTL